jgi:hypothetical protein
LILYGDRCTWASSGLTNPLLHIFAAEGTDIATTDGNTYKLASGVQYPSDDPAAVAADVGHGGRAQFGAEPSNCSRPAQELMKSSVIARCLPSPPPSGGCR